MLLYINEKPIDFVLQSEKTFYDIVTSLEQDIQSTKGNISSIVLDGQQMLLQEHLWKDIPIEKIDNVYVEADFTYITLVKQLQIIIEYIDTIEHYAKESLLFTQAEKEDIAYIMTSIDTIGVKSDITHYPLKTLLEYVCHTTGLLSEYKPHPLVISDIDIILKHIRMTLYQRIFLILNDNSQWIQINTLITEYIPLFTKVSEYLSPDKEVLGINQLIISIDLLTQWLQVLSHVPSCIDDKQHTEDWMELHKRYTGELQVFFDELSNALEHKDWVTINDLIEYEISPLLHEYSQKVSEYYSA